ncbi:MAG TPA: RlmE family RNA methyltransferase [Oligoflexia bacterium]|nr:RlmE family RNA methyltransferase [Oligoflexia bacterium]
MPGNYDRKDHLYRKAKQEGYRSRAAYKLIELDHRYKLIRQRMSVVDLGCYPGGWLQVVLERIGQQGLLVGVDLNYVEPVSVKGKEAAIIKGDIFSEETRAEILSRAGGKVSLVLSDLSPQLSGVRFRDAVKSAELVECALDLSREILENGGSLVAKIFPGPECDSLVEKFRASFRVFSRASLKSSRKSSTELYFVAREFRGC